MSDFYIFLNNEESGPFDLQELEVMVRNGEIPTETLYARPGMPAWEPLSKVVSVGSEAPDQSSTAQTHYKIPNGSDQARPSTIYEDSGYSALMEAFPRLSNYDAVNDWDARAAEEVRKIVEVLRGLDCAIADESVALAQAAHEFQQQSFLQRAFGGHDLESSIAARIGQLRQRKVQLLQMVRQLQEAIDFTPNTPAEKVLLLKELRHRKKELLAQKREASATMAAIRQEARVKSAHAGKTWLGLYDSGLAADQRRGIRYAKEAALRPHEDAKAAIERQLIKVDRDILWVDRFD